MSAATALLPEQLCSYLANRIAVHDTPMGLDRGAAMAVALADQWPSFKVDNEKAYMRSLRKIFSAYPDVIGARVCDPVLGLPGSHKFGELKLADVKAALDYEVKRMRLIRAQALNHNAERKRRAEAEAEDRRIEQSKGDAEQRARFVAAQLARLSASSQ